MAHQTSKTSQKQLAHLAAEGLSILISTPYLRQEHETTVLNNSLKH